MELFLYILWLYENLFCKGLQQFDTFLQPDNIVVCSFGFLPYVLDILIQSSKNASIQALDPNEV